MIAGVVKYKLEKKLVPADDFITFVGAGFAVQKKCYLKPLISEMYALPCFDFKDITLRIFKF